MLCCLQASMPQTNQDNTSAAPALETASSVAQLEARTDAQPDATDATLVPAPSPAGGCAPATRLSLVLQAVNAVDATLIHQRLCAQVQHKCARAHGAGGTSWH
jgi:hypothetical protein